MSKLHNPYGDGLASKRIVKFMKSLTETEVATFRLGYIGLPTSALIAKNKTHVHGVDINLEVVDTINRGEIIVEPSPVEVVTKAVGDGFLKASTKVVEAIVYLVVVPTPFKNNHEPDIFGVESATNDIILSLKKGDLVHY